MQTHEIIIHGTTSNGKVFRPSDWAERLCGILSSFTKDNRLSYHEWVHPVLIEKIRCVSIDAKLEEINPPMFRFLMDFAADNDLRVMSAEELNYHMPEKPAESAPPSETPLPTAQTYEPKTDELLSEAVADAKLHSSQIREIAPNETASAFAALSVLRPTLNDINKFVEQVNTIQRVNGYRLFGVFEEGKSNAVAVCGLSERTTLVSGRHIFIEDLVTIPNCRGKGYAAALLEEVRKFAVSQNINNIEADSHVGAERAGSHRLYFQSGFTIRAYHFVCTTK